ncbi:MAG: ABC transporter substrate-binding protein [Paracoccaceae bacterium]
MSARRSDILRAVAAALVLAGAAQVAGAEGGSSSPAAIAAADGAANPPAGAPLRVVSMNLCTDQLAMLLAAPGQLVSVSNLATDPLSSSMVDRARDYVPNRGQAEQIFLMHPDLVLAGTYTATATVDLLDRLGVRVVRVPPVASLADVADQMRLVGRVLGRAAEGEAMARDFEAQVQALRIDLPPATAAMYYPNGYTTGAGTVADEILRLTGFRNVGAEAGLTGGGTLPLERLVMAAPRMIVTSQPYPGASRSEEILVHPALRALQARAASATMSDADWVCGTPYMLRAIAAMAAARRALEPSARGDDPGPQGGAG